MSEEIEVSNENEPEEEGLDDVIDAEPAEFPDPREEGVRHREEGQTYRGGKSARMDSFTWALILMWAGAVMLMKNLGVLTDLLSRLNLRLADVPWHLPVSSEVWSFFFLGLGVILLLGVIVRLIVPSFRYDVLGNAILVIVAFAVAFGRAELIWPLILIAVGVAILVRQKS